MSPPPQPLPRKRERGARQRGRGCYLHFYRGLMKLLAIRLSPQADKSLVMETAPTVTVAAIVSKSFLWLTGDEIGMRLHLPG